jgi:tetratricopeptide (TPR) repeat protein
MRRFLLAAALVAAFAGPVAADQKDPRLTDLFDRLKSAPTLAAARPIEAQIWDIWSATDREEVNLLMQLGVTAMAREDYATALQLFDKIVEVAPDFAEGWNKRATVLYLIGEFDRSRADVGRTLALEPRHFGALSGLGLIYMAQGQYDKALMAFEQALAINPTMPGPLLYVEQLKKRLQGEPI